MQSSERETTSVAVVALQADHGHRAQTVAQDDHLGSTGWLRQSCLAGRASILGAADADQNRGLRKAHRRGSRGRISSMTVAHAMTRRRAPYR